MARDMGLTLGKNKTKPKRLNKSNSDIPLASLSYGMNTSSLKKALPRKVAHVPLRDSVERILGRGIMIDAWMTVSVIGLRVADIEAKVSVSSLETYLKYADAIRETIISVSSVSVRTKPISVE